MLDKDEKICIVNMVFNAFSFEALTADHRDELTAMCGDKRREKSFNLVLNAFFFRSL